MKKIASYIIPSLAIWGALALSIIFFLHLTKNGEVGEIIFTIFWMVFSLLLFPASFVMCYRLSRVITRWRRMRRYRQKVRIGT